jgi:hypothetical protein
VTRPTPSPAGPGRTGPTPTGTATYEIRVAGHLDDHWAALLGEFTLVRLDDGTTNLTGQVVDQAQLHGVLARIRDLGVPLLLLRTLDGPVRQPDEVGEPTRRQQSARKQRDHRAPDLRHRLRAASAGADSTMLVQLAFKLVSQAVRCRSNHE